MGRPDPSRLLDHPQAAIHIGLDRCPALSQLQPVTVAVEGHAVTLERHLTGQRRAAFHLLTDHEERGLVPRPREKLEHGRGPLGMRTVVERQRHRAGLRANGPLDVERFGGTWHDGGEGVSEHLLLRSSLTVSPDLDRWLPSPMLRVAHSRHSKASPEELWAAARMVRISDAALLGRLIRWRIPGTRPQITFDELFRQPPFLVLEGGQDMALVSGLVGRIWTLRRDYPRLSDPEDFRQWSARGTARVVFANWVSDEEGGRSTLSSEARVDAIGAQGRLGVAAVRPLVSAFQHLIASDGIAAAVRRAEKRGSGRARSRAPGR